jgi:hypothetical protein
VVIIIAYTLRSSALNSNKNTHPWKWRLVQQIKAFN